MNKSTLILNFTFTASIILLIVLSWLSYDTTKRYIIYSEAVNHTNIVLWKVEEISSLIKDAETGQRGYSLTQEPVFLEPYDNALKNVWTAWREARELTSDNQIQQMRLDTMKYLINAKFDILKDMIQKDTSKIISKWERIEGLKKGKSIMDNIRLVILRLQQEEKQILETREREKKSNEISVPYFILIISISAFFLLTIFYFSVQRELKKRLFTQFALKENIEALNRSNSELEQFAYVASHDLQEPTRKMRAFSDRLLVKYKNKLEPDMEQMLERISESAQRMQTLIDDLLLFSRLVNKTGDQEITDLNETIKVILNDLSETIQSKNAQVYISQLPSILSYSTQIRQLFQNLLTNALKFNHPDITPEVFIDYTTVKGNEIEGVKEKDLSTGFYKITVRDNGIGFEEKYLEKIFIIFQRLHTRTEYTGTGIGLAICKRVVTNHQGYITAQSKLGEGATFIVYLPIKQFESGQL